MSIGQVIKVVREERGLTQSQFAHELFVTQQALSRWELSLIHISEPTRP